jgi:hypothetical protein
MPSQELLVEIVKIVEAELKPLGFRKVKGVFVCPVGADMFGWLGLNTASHRNDGRVGINPVVGVRSERIEQRIGRLLGEKQPRLAPTICTSLGYLMPEARYVEWLFEPAPFDYLSECKRMARAVEVYGMPFMNSNSTLTAQLQDLEHLRFSSKETAVYRCPVAYLLSGRTELAAAYVKRQLEELGDREDLAAQQYKTFALNLFREV